MIHTRRNFTKATKREAYQRSGGICECHRVPMLPTFGEGCGAKLSPGNCFYEHITPDGILGEPTLENCGALVKTCWKLKTDSYDKRIIAKAKRNADRNTGIETFSYRPMNGTKASGISIPFRGGPINRRTGQPLFVRR